MCYLALALEALVCRCCHLQTEPGETVSPCFQSLCEGKVTIQLYILRMREQYRYPCKKVNNADLFLKIFRLWLVHEIAETKTNLSCCEPHQSLSTCVCHSQPCTWTPQRASAHLQPVLPQFTGSGPTVCAKSHVARREREVQRSGVGRRRGCRGHKEQDTGSGER